MRTPINNQIRAREVRVIDDTGKQLGVMTLENALLAAKERGLDLIQVTEKVEPPVCKIMEYGKYAYQEEKKRRKMAKQKGGELKEIRFGYNISEHDLSIRAKQAEKFLKEGNQVKVQLRLRGREKALGNFAREKVMKFFEILQTFTPFKIEKELRREPQGFTTIISKG